MSSSSGMQPHIRIADIIPIEYGDFLTYCGIAGKMFSDEITPVDYVAYRSQFGHEKKEVKKLRSIIEDSVLLRKADSETELSVNFCEKSKTVDLTNDKVPDIGLEIKAADNKTKTTEANENKVKYFDLFDNPENSEITYADILGLEAGDFDEISLEKDIYPMLSVSLTARPLNALRRNDCFTLGNLLLMTPSKLRRIKNMGLKSVKEIESLFMKISNTSVRKKLVSTSVKTMFSGKQGYADELSDDEKTYIIKAKEAAAILGNEFCLDIMQNDRKEYIKCIIDVFTAFGQRISVRHEIAASAEKAAADWDEAIYSKKLLPFVRLYCLSHKRYVSDDFKKFMSADVLAADYIKMIKNQLEILNDYRNDILVKELAKFQTWMAGINLTDFCKKAFDKSNWSDSKSKHSFEVLSARVAGRTLEEIACQYGITRERVRQIEKKTLNDVYRRLPRRIYNIFGLISAYRNGEHIIYKDGIIETIGQEYGSILWYCASHFENRTENTYMLVTKIARYDNRLKAILVFDEENTAAKAPDDAEKIAEKFVEGLPELIETVALNKKLEAYANEKGIYKEFLAQEAAKQYRETGIYSYKGHLMAVQMYEFVFKTRFQNGYKIADETDGGLFIKYLTEFFGEMGRGTRRAIDAKIMEIGVLIDRGKYVHRDYINVDRKIINKVFAYIKKSTKSAIAYSELFSSLKDLFKGTAITNRYILQGVMKLYGCPYTSHRDYTSKNGSASLEVELDTFVKAAGVVHKSEILEEFPGWKDYNLALILPRCSEIISLDDGYYMHASRLHITEDDRHNIKKYLDKNIHEIPVSTRYLQDEFMIAFTDFMIRNDIQKHGKLFGVLQYMFSGDFYFSRPYICRENMGDVTNKAVLLKHLDDITAIEIDDFVDICKQNSVHYVSLSYLLDMMQPELIRVDSFTLMRIESIGLSEDMYENISDLIAESVNGHNGYIAVDNIEDFSWYPTLNIPWTPFLLESTASIIGGVNIIKIKSSSSDITHSIFVCDDYADDDWNSLLVKLLKEEHSREPFYSKDEIFRWLKAEGLCNTKYPAFLDKESHVYYDETGKLRIE